jgi:cysteine-rich repeat protein
MVSLRSVCTWGVAVGLGLTGCGKVLGLDQYQALRSTSDAPGGAAGSAGQPTLGGAAGISNTAGVTGAPAGAINQGGAAGFGGFGGGFAAGGGVGTQVPHCGNGSIDQPQEECDDGNEIDDDSCTNACIVNCSAYPGTVIKHPWDWHCYGLSNEHKTFEAAKNACEAASGHLVTITSPAENALMGLFQQAALWIGATDGQAPDVGVLGQYQWVTQEPFHVFQAWRANEPSVSQFDCAGVPCYEHCLALELGGAWNDRHCEQTLPYVCEWAPVGTRRVIPYSGEPLVIGENTVVALENFDRGGEGLAYHDSDPFNVGLRYRTEGPDIKWTGEGALGIGWFGAGEWLGYTIDVAAAGAYWVVARGANGSGSPASLQLEFGPPGQVGGAGLLASTPITVAPTGGFGAWKDVVGTVSLSEGVQWLRLVAQTGGVDVRTLTFVLASPGVEAPWSFCALEDTWCAFQGTREVRFGVDGTFLTRSATDGILCDRVTFGDPVPYVPKACEYR